MSILLFIPARKNSKGIKNKNIVKLKNKPLIQHTSKFVEKFIRIHGKDNKSEFFVSTDSKDILKFCKKNFLFNGYLRPKFLAGDKSNIVDVILHASEWLKKNKQKFFKTIVLLQPTNPIRDIEELNQMIKYYKNKKLKSLISVVKMKEHPYECVEINKNKWSYLAKPSKPALGRQDYKNNFFFIDGSYYIIDTEYLKKYKKLIMPNITKFFSIKRVFPVDIDNQNDLKIADLLLKSKIKL